MAALWTIPQTISYADLSISLLGNDIAKGELFGGRLAPRCSPATIAIITDALRWRYAGDPTDDTLRGTANYVQWLTGPFGQQAQYIITNNSGGGTVIPGGPSLINYYDFQVNISSLIPTGGTTVTLPSTWTGLNILLVRGGTAQSQINDGVSAYYSWNKTTRLLTLINGAATDGELIQIYPIL